MATLTSVSIWFRHLWFRRLWLTVTVAACLGLAACSDQPPVTDFTSSETARESLGVVLDRLSEDDRDRVIDALAWSLLARDGAPESAPGSRDHDRLLQAISRMDDGAPDRLAQAGFDGLAGPALVERARALLLDLVGRELARTGVRLRDAEAPLLDFMTTVSATGTVLSQLVVSGPTVDRGVIHQADRARVRVTIENRFDEPIVRVGLTVSVTDPDAGVHAEATVAIRLDRPLYTGSRTSVAGMTGIGDALDGDLAAAYSGQRHRGAVTVTVDSVEFMDGGAIRMPTPPAPGLLVHRAELRERHEEWIDRFDLARGLSVDWLPVDDESSEEIEDDASESNPPLSRRADDGRSDHAQAGGAIIAIRERI